MIFVKIYKNRNGEYAGFSCKGHAGYAEHGSDVVCSAVSMLVINTINSIDHLTECYFEVDANEENGDIRVAFPDGVSKEAILLLDSMVLGIEETIKEYGKAYVKMKIKEV